MFRQWMIGLVVAAWLVPAIVHAGEAVTPQQAREALARSVAAIRAIATGGGYLWWYSPDLTERWGEGKATASQIWVQPPGTPSVGMAFLRAYEATGDAPYLDAARDAAMALARGQLESGGWDYRIDFDPAQLAVSYRREDVGRLAPAVAAKRRNVSTFDDDNTQSALRFLMAFVQAAKEREDAWTPAIRAAMEHGLAKMLEAQYPNGAWPQRWDGRPHDAGRFPVKRARIPEAYPREHAKTSYSGHYTLNDDTQRDCIRTLLEAWRRFGRAEHLAAAKKGGDFLILAQLPAPQAAWAQQYNADMEPAWARAFEPPAVCSAESVGVMRTLMELYVETGEEKYLRPIPVAIDWFGWSQLRPGVWARFYELTTNRPIYGDRDGLIHYTLEELSEERRRGYSWQGGYGAAAAIEAYERLRRQGREAYREGLARSAPTEQRRQAQRQEAARVIAALDEQGRWISNGRIEMRVFARNLNALCEYLEGVGRE